MQPLVSILIPAYNAEQWISDAIESAVAQTWSRKEIIVVDDGSRDATLAAANRFASREVKIATQPNQGASVARNHALRLCQGDYIQWLDADDLLEKDKIRLQIESADAKDDRVLFSSSWGFFSYQKRRTQFKLTSLWRDQSPADFFRVKMEENLWMSIESWLVSRQLTDLAGPWNANLRRDNDGEYFCRIISNSTGIRFIANAKSYVRTANRRSISNDANLSDSKLESLMQSMTIQIRSLLSLENSPRTRAACLNMLRGGLIWFYPERPTLVAQARRLASELGGDLTRPRLSWKYTWIQKVFGWQLTKKMMFQMPKLGPVLASARDNFYNLFGRQH